MIPLIILAASAAAAGVGVVATRLLRSKRRQQGERAEEAAKEADAAPIVDEPIALGDAMVLDAGRGTELCLVRRLSLREADGDPFLVLFEASESRGSAGPDVHRAVVAFDPLRADRVAVLELRAVPEVSVMGGGRTSRPPTTLDVVIDGVSETLQLEMRRGARAKHHESSEGEGDDEGILPPPGDALLVATYRGGATCAAVVVRDDAGVVRSYVGRTVGVDTISVLRNRARPPR